MSTISRWLNWTPRQFEIIETSADDKPTKPSKSGFVGFDGSQFAGEMINRDPEPAPLNLIDGCPYSLPDGVQLVRFERKTSEVALAVYSIVSDPDKFIRHALIELGARLHNPIQIKAGDSVFDLLSKLADCGLELRLEWPPQSRTREVECQ